MSVKLKTVSPAFSGAGDGAGAVSAAVPAPSSVRDARAIVERLQGNLSALHLTRSKLDVESKTLAFDAHAADDADAKHRIAAVRKRRAELDIEAEEITAAIEVAKGRVAAAERDAAIAAARPAGEEAIAALPDLEASLGKLDAAFAGVNAAVREIEVLWDAFNLRGCPPVGRDMLKLKLKDVKAAAVQGTILQSDEFMLPARRVKAIDFAESGSRNVRVRAASKMGD